MLHRSEIKARREEMGLSRAEVARMAHVSPEVVKRVEESRKVRESSLHAILRALEGEHKVDVPEVQVTPVADPVGKAISDLVGALKTDLLSKVDEIIEEKIQERLLKLALDPLTNYLPKVDKESVPADISPPQTVHSHGLPTTSVPTDWRIGYTRRFMKDLDVMGGARGLALTAVRKFAAFGETHSGTGWKKYAILTESSNPSHFQGAEYGFRINRRWRILCRKDNNARIYTLTRIVHHDEIE